FLWSMIRKYFILQSELIRIEKAYASIWEGDSPIRKILKSQVELLDPRLADSMAPFRVSVHPAMSYGNPGLPDVMDTLRREGVDHFVILPLFPQYSASSGGAVYDALTKWTLKQRNLPNYSIVKDYFAHPLYIKALANSIRR